MRTILVGEVPIAHAHSGTNSYAYVVFSNGSIEGNVQIPITDLNEVLQLALPSDESGALEAIRQHRDVIEGYAAQHLRLASNGEPWLLKFTGHRVLARKSYSYAILDYAIDGTLSRPADRLTVAFDAILHAKPQHEGLAIVRTTAGLGPLQHTRETTLTFTHDKTSHEVAIPEESTRNNLAGVAQELGHQGRRLFKRVRKRVARIGSKS